MLACDVETANGVPELVPALRINTLRHFAHVACAKLRTRLFDQVDGKDTELKGRSRNVKEGIANIFERQGINVVKFKEWRSHDSRATPWAETLLFHSQIPKSELQPLQRLTTKLTGLRMSLHRYFFCVVAIRRFQSLPASNSPCGVVWSTTTSSLIGVFQNLLRNSVAHAP
jgi:hypothetical protein